MSNTENVSQTPKSFVSRFNISFEIVIIYLITGLIIFAFFETIKAVFYATLAYIALFMFLSVFVVMASYTVYNFVKVIYLLLER